MPHPHRNRRHSSSTISASSSSTCDECDNDDRSATNRTKTTSYVSNSDYLDKSIDFTSNNSADGNSTITPRTESRLTRENLRRFEKEQEEQDKRQRIRSITPTNYGHHKSSHPVQKSPAPTSITIPTDQTRNHQIFVLDRVVEMDVAKHPDEKYACCCRCTNFYRGAWLVGFVEALIVSSALVTVIVNYGRLGRNYFDHFVVTVALSLAYMVVLALHFCGLQGKSACMLLPNLIAQLISMILFVTTSILIGLLLTSDDQAPLVIWAGMGPLYGDLAKDAGLNLLTVGCMLIGVCVLAFLFYIWFFYVCYKCYRFLSDHRRHRKGLVYNETKGSLKGSTMIGVGSKD